MSWTFGSVDPVFSNSILPWKPLSVSLANVPVYHNIANRVGLCLKASVSFMSTTLLLSGSLVLLSDSHFWWIIEAWNAQGLLITERDGGFGLDSSYLPISTIEGFCLGAIYWLIKLPRRNLNILIQSVISVPGKGSFDGKYANFFQEQVWLVCQIRPACQI